MPLTTFDQTTSVVTGAAHGIGRALALRLAAEGSSVVLADVRPADVAAVAEEITVRGGRALAVGYDVSSRDSVAELGREVAHWSAGRSDGVDLLCLNAGVFTPRHAMTATPEDWAWVLGVNLGGVVHGVAEFLPGMLEADAPTHLLVTASMNGYVPSRQSPLYAASKFAVVGLVESLRLELAGRRTGITLLNPSAVRTEIARSEEVRAPRFERSREDPPDPAYADQGLGPALDPDEVARVALDAVLEGREVVFTDPVMADLLEAGHRRLLAAVPAHPLTPAAAPPGARTARPRRRPR